MVAHHAHRSHWQQHRESLRTATDITFFIHLDVGQVSLPQLFIENGICLADDFNSFRGYFTEYPHCQTGTREGLPPNQIERKPKHLTNRADFILEEVAQRFHQFEFQIFRQTADVVMRFDAMGF